MNPCQCCTHIEDGGGDASCMPCKWIAPDNFVPSGPCVGCQYDPRLHGVCKRCVDGDKRRMKTFRVRLAIVLSYPMLFALDALIMLAGTTNKTFSQHRADTRDSLKISWKRAR
jgi:hypothetical protein